MEPYELAARHFDGLLGGAPEDAVQCFLELAPGRFQALPLPAGFEQWRTQLNTANREHAGRLFAVDRRQGAILTVDEEPSIGIAIQRPVVRADEAPLPSRPGRRGRLSPLAEWAR